MSTPPDCVANVAATRWPSSGLAFGQGVPQLQCDRFANAAAFRALTREAKMGLVGLSEAGQQPKPVGFPALLDRGQQPLKEVAEQIQGDLAPVGFQPLDRPRIYEETNVPYDIDVDKVEPRLRPFE